MNPVNQVHHFIRTAEENLILNPSLLGNQPMFANGGVTNGAVDAFKLECTPHHSELTDLFDQYKIKKVELTFFYSNTEQAAVAGATTTTHNMLMHYGVKDTDDGTPVANAAELSEYASCKITQLSKPYTVTIYPKIAIAAYQDGVFTAYAADTNKWIDSDFPDVEYYGYKWGLDFLGDNTNAQIGMLKVVSKYYIDCRNTK